MPKNYLALGLMSGTSLDGIDAALVETDGERMAHFGASVFVPYSDTMRQTLHQATLLQGDLPEVEHQLTLWHAEAVHTLLQQANISPEQVDVIGFHGQTVAHRPQQGITWQLGNGALLAAKTGVDVVSDFRRMDMANGGQGAPLIPLFHAALCKGLSGATMMVNIGGISNVTYVPEGADIRQLHACDTGPGNVLLDCWVQQHAGIPFDKDGQVAQAGQVHENRLKLLLQHEYFSRNEGNKSLDRHDFSLEVVEGLSVEDGAATLAAFTAESIARAGVAVAEVPERWLVGGGGRHHPVIMRELQRRVTGIVSPVESMGWDGDAFEAQAFAFLAVRSLRGLPLSVPETTGVCKPVTGGAFYRKV